MPEAPEMQVVAEFLNSRLGRQACTGREDPEADSEIARR